MKQQAQRPSRAKSLTREHKRVRDWASLAPGCCVEVCPYDSFCYAAYVDDLADDGRFIWVIEKGTNCRRLFVRGDPVALYSLSTLPSIDTDRVANS